MLRAQAKEVLSEEEDQTGMVSWVEGGKGRGGRVSRPYAEGAG
jgi:hypothetical protein